MYITSTHRQPAVGVLKVNPLRRRRRRRRRIGIPHRTAPHRTDTTRLAAGKCWGRGVEGMTDNSHTGRTLSPLPSPAHSSP